MGPMEQKPVSRADYMAAAISRDKAQDEVDRLWEHLDDIERACTISEDADATVNAVVDGIQRLRKELGKE